MDGRSQRGLSSEGGRQGLPIDDRKRYVLGSNFQRDDQKRAEERDHDGESPNLPSLEMSKSSFFFSRHRCNTVSPTVPKVHQVQEQRRHFRKPIELPIEFNVADGPRKPGVCRDFSLGGMHIDTAETAPSAPTSPST